MSYRSDTISTITNLLNIRYFLPAIQREFVWDPDDIIKLFDSVMRGYPIGSFLFWELAQENRDKWDVYKFVDRARQGGTHNQPANIAGVQQLTLVLDGQQRLTSLLVGLKGTYRIKRKYRRWDDPDAWVEYTLYLDLLKDPREEEEDGESGVYYGFRFLDQSPPNDNNQHWFKVGDILDFDSEDRFYEFRQEERDKLSDDVTKAQMAIFERNLERLYRALWKDDFIAYYTEQEQDYDRVLDIFVRANEAGTKLSKSDLLLSMVTLRWEGLNAREEIYGFVDRINDALLRKNAFDKDFVMKACLVLSDLPVQYRVNNFNNENLAMIQSKWNKIKVAIESSVNLANSFGIDRDTLTSANALIPIAYYMLRNGRSPLGGSSPSDVRNAERIRRWLTTALLNNVFAGASDTVLRDIRDVLQQNVESSGDFAVGEIQRRLVQRGRTARFDEDTISNFLDITYGTRVAFLALSLLYNDRNWGTVTYHKDHIYPRSLFTAKSLTEAGISPDRHTRYTSLMDRVGNLQLLLSHENEDKSNRDFSEWLTTRDTEFRRRHLIPTDDSLLTLERFDEFVEAREDLIRRRLSKLLSTDPALD